MAAFHGPAGGGSPARAKRDSKIWNASFLGIPAAGRKQKPSALKTQALARRPACHGWRR